MGKIELNPSCFHNCDAFVTDHHGNGLKLKVNYSEVKCDIEAPVQVALYCTLADRNSVRGVQNDKKLTVRKVIYNPPATIVLWEDGTKTVVKCDPRDEYDPKYGFALCYMKKALGNTSRALNDALHKEAVKV